jgi:hypothetical protein
VETFALSLKVKEEGAAAVEASIKRLSSVAKAAAGLAGLGGLALALRKLTMATSVAQFGQAQLAAAIKSTGGAAGQSVSALNAHASALQRTSIFGDEAVNKAQALLLTFTKIQGDTFPKATEAVLNVATAMGTDLQSAAIQVGKALNDPILGVTALARSGIQFTQAQKDTIKALVETGQQAQAQTLILKELEVQFGGSAKAARETFGGALKGVTNAFGDLFEMSREASSGIVKSLNVVENALIGLNRHMADAVSFVTTLGIAFVATKALAIAFGAAAVSAMLPIIATVSALSLAFDFYLNKQRSAIDAQDEASAKNPAYVAALEAIRARRVAATAAEEAAAEALRKVNEETATRVQNLIKLGQFSALTTAETATLAAADRALTVQLRNGNLPLSERVALMEKQAAIQQALTAEQLRATSAERAQNALRIALQNEGKRATGTTVTGRPTSGAFAPLQLPPLKPLVDKAASAAAEMGHQIREVFAQSIVNSLGDGIASGFAALTAPGGNIGKAFNAFTGMMLGGIGDAMIRFGVAGLGFAKLQEKIMTMLSSLNPKGAIAASLLMIAAGGALKGAAAGMFQRGTGGVGITSVGGAGMGTGLGMGQGTTTQLIFGATSATTAAGMTPRSSMNVTIIGPNDPTAQRAMQELMRNANQRGTLG